MNEIVLKELPSELLGINGRNTESVREQLRAIGASDPEVGHSIADQLLIAALQLIADGHSSPRKLAADTLTICSAEFPRWCA